MVKIACKDCHYQSDKTYCKWLETGTCTAFYFAKLWHNAGYRKTKLK